MKKGTDDSYALKQLSLKRVLEDQIMEQVLAERDVMNTVGTHPYIIKLFSFWKTKESIFFLMEYVPDGDMFDHVRTNSKLPAEEAARYTFQMAQALDFLGEKGVIFRDLKLENVLLTHEKRSVLLADFGLAKQFTAKQQARTTKTICGTIQYMAPEILKGEAYGREVDWWSLGVLGYLMYVLFWGFFEVVLCVCGMSLGGSARDGSGPQHFTIKLPHYICDRPAPTNNTYPSPLH
jgi:serine/threonine protein kinase